MSIILTLPLVAISTILAFVGCYLLVGVYSLNYYEIRHKAQKGNRDAKIVYPLKAMGYQFIFSLFVGIIICVSIASVLIATTSPFLWALLEVMIVLLFVGVLPILLPRKYVVPLLARAQPVLRYYTNLISPVSKPMSRFIESRTNSSQATLFSKEELYKILEEHRASDFIDIEANEISIVRHALEYGTKQVRQVMTPRRVVLTVSADDEVGPILLDELHKSGHSRFPVYNDKKTQNFIGTLYLHDLVLHKDAAKVKDFMRKDVMYVHEEQMLDHALKALIKHNHHLMIVVNTFEEFVGVVSMEDIIEEILGQEIVDEFDQHTDLRAVAKSLADKERSKRETPAKK